MQLERARVHIEAPTCPYCREAVPTGVPQLACNECRAWHHQACWLEGQRACSSCGGTSSGLDASSAERAGAPPVEAFRPLLRAAPAATTAPRAATPTGAVPCAPCGGAARIPNAVGRCGVCGEPLGRPAVSTTPPFAITLWHVRALFQGIGALFGGFGVLVTLTHLRVGLLFMALGAWFIVQARGEAAGRRGPRT